MAAARELAQAHLVPHFTRAAAWRSGQLPVIVRGEGCYVHDDTGRRFLDGLSGLFCVNIGHGRGDIAAAAAKQMETLAYATNWAAAHPASVEAAALIAELAPGDLDGVFFVNSGSEAVESAVKFSRQYHRSQGQPGRTKIIAREMAYHGTTMGALSVTGIPAYREPFEPLLPGVIRVPNTLGATSDSATSDSATSDSATSDSGAPDSGAPDSGGARDLACVRAIEEAIEREGAETIAAIVAEPVQNARGALVPPPGYWAELRAICDRTGILLVADEVVNGFGRLGEWFGVDREGIVPDLLTFAKGSTSGYAPLGGLLVRRPLLEAVFSGADGIFTHGSTWGGHPVATAVAVANINALRLEDVPGNVRRLGPVLAEGLSDIARRHPTVREVRGTGYFYALEFMADRDSSLELRPEQSVALLREVLPAAMKRVGLLTRPDDRGATMLMLAPPLVADRAVLGELLSQTDAVVDEVDRFIRGSRSIQGSR